ncbi:hypothetical protein DVH24_025459 [Malus domestica]|uniref:Uncharacterized protein n=1 Tax=Malus domestica TaxID=3750 RepID=A0A498HKB0_MALDO|nr:hypothetical protein DVH24_025459 [Malus domestica]
MGCVDITPLNLTPVAIRVTNLDPGPGICMIAFKGKKVILPTLTFFFLFFKLSLILHFIQAEPIVVPHHNRRNFPDDEDEKSYVRSSTVAGCSRRPISATPSVVPTRAEKETRKVDSPNLHPLSPFAWQTSRLRRWENAKSVPTHDRDNEEEEEEEEFYSPRGSSGDRDSSNRNENGSGSRRVFAAVPGGVFDERVRGLQTTIVVWNRLGEKEEDRGVVMHIPT